MRWLRLIPAWAITFVALPYLWGRFFVFALMDVRDVALAGWTAVWILAVMGLTWNVRPPGRTWGTLVTWLIVNTGLYWAFADTRIPMWLLLLMVVPSTVWVMWLAWLGAWPMSWSKRWTGLAVCAALGVQAAVILRVEGMTGDVHLVFV